MGVPSSQRALELCHLHLAASAVRVCIAAAEANLNLKGAKFLVTGEPLTPHKKREIESAGAIAIPVYESPRRAWLPRAATSAYDK